MGGVENRTARIAVDRARQVLEVEAAAIHDLVDRIDGSFTAAVETIAGCGGRVFTSGIGKSGIICQKIASTLSSTGTPAMFMHPVEAIHGDLGMLLHGDAMIVLSSSGETEELLRLVPVVKRIGAPLIGIVGRPDSSVARECDIVLDVSIREEACPLGLAPTASTTAALAMGDALAMALIERRGFSAEQFAERHPGGNLGKRFLRVSELMHGGDRLPRVSVDATVQDAIFEMTSKGFGATSVVTAEGKLAGIVTDGDLRRLLATDPADPLGIKVVAVMTARPLTIDGDELAASALEVMERRHVTSLLVVDGDDRPAGLLHIHDLWRTQLF
ncbi:MAG: KpsF/GutQ family sugar-phosphate isomerase [Acidobacteria bacterium]|nr:KpsF/GutQ family sugar-phosphate isomerase [Acidobacteriota bacterium]